MYLTECLPKPVVLTLGFAVYRWVFGTLCWSIMITSILGRIHQGHEAFSEHSRGRQCAFMSLKALLFNQLNLVDLWTQTNIDDILCHGDCMYLHALTNKMVPDANSLSKEELSKEELLEVATLQNNVEYRLNYNKFCHGRTYRSCCGDGPFWSLKQALINALSDSSNAMLVLDGYVMAVIKKSDFLYLFDLCAWNSLGITKYLVYFHVALDRQKKVALIVLRVS